MSDTPNRVVEEAEAKEPAPVLRESDLDEAIEAGDASACERWLGLASGDETVHALAGLSDSARQALLSTLSPAGAAGVVEFLPQSMAVEAIQGLDPTVAASILEELASDDRADVIRALDAGDAEAILTELDDAIARDARRLAAYEDDSAGALMLTEYLAFPESATIRDVLTDIEANAERYADYNIQYSYVIDDGRRLRGVLPIRTLLLASRVSRVRDVMITEPLSVSDATPIDGLRAMFRDHPFMGFPVVGSGGELLGVVERSDVSTAAVEEADDVYRRSQGIVGGEELRSMPLLLRSRRRLAWLSANIVLNIIAASMIALHQDTLEAVIALAVFLPIISDMSGCSGNQAVAVSMRELTLGVTRPRDVARVLAKEASVGVLNGVALGVLIGAAAFLWKGNVYLSVVVGAALALNTVVAVCIGGLVPLLLKRLRSDPALASGPILTTITDMCGFFVVLTFASMMLSRLT